MAKKFLIGVALIALIVVPVYLWLEHGTVIRADGTASKNGAAQPGESAPSAQTRGESDGSIPQQKYIENLSHVGQSFNNCSSVGLMIALSHWGIRDTQEAIAEATRPWNNPSGNNDDKSVTLYELATYAEEKYGLATYVRPNGTIETLKEFIANDIPVVARALMYPDDDIVHYRVVRGYDDSAQTLFESDGIEGPRVPYTYTNWMRMWKDFNYAYLIVVPPEKASLVEKILGEEADERVAWQNARARAEVELAENPNDLRVHYNLITALYYLGDYEATVREFEKIEPSLSRRKLWYQMEPIQAYFELGNYDRVLELSDAIINDNNKSVSELYVLRGKIFESRGDTATARAEYEKAVQYHKHLESAQEAITSFGG